MIIDKKKERTRRIVDFAVRTDHTVKIKDSDKIVCFSLVWFYGISTIVGYLMPNPVYTYILNIYDVIWLGFMAYRPLLVI